MNLNNTNLNLNNLIQSEVDRISTKYNLHTLSLKRSNVGEKNKMKGKIQIQMLGLI